MNVRNAVFTAVACGFLAVPAFVNADMTWNFNSVVSGDTPGGPTPWATLTCTDVAGGADFTLTFNSFTGAGSTTEFLKQLDLGYNGTLPSDVSFSTSDSNQITGSSFGPFVDAGGHYQVMVDFNTPNNGNRVTPGDTVSFSVTGTGVNCENFTTALLHINGTTGPEGSSKVAPVPEPTSMAALGMGALGLFSRRRRARK